jgi:putative membrane protein
MSHARFDSAAQESLTACVREIEKTTDAELVLIVRARSGSYRHADYLFGVVLALGGLIFLLFSPFNFHPNWVLIDVVLVFLLGTFLSSRSNEIRRVLTREKFRAGMVRTFAAAMFYERGVANTRGETGILVYLSLFERRLELIADRGVLKAIPALEWNQQAFALHEAGRTGDANVLLEAFRDLSALLATHLPATGENPNELPDTPGFEV